MFHGTKTGLAMSLAAAVAVLVSAPALAGNPDRSKLDVNRDGKVDFSEAQAARPDFTQDQFNKADANRDGQLSDEEWSTLPGKGHHYGVVDSNKDGNYSLDEVRATNPNLTQQEYADFDANGRQGHQGRAEGDDGQAGRPVIRRLDWSRPGTVCPAFFFGVSLEGLPVRSLPVCARLQIA